MGASFPLVHSLGVPHRFTLSASMGDNILSLLGMLLTVAAVLALAYWCTKLIGRRGMPGWARGLNGADKLQLLWQVSVGRNERLVLVRLGSRCLLLGVTGGGVSLITELTQEEAAPWLQKPEVTAQQPSFLEILRDNVPKKK